MSDPEDAARSLYDRIGGAETIEAVVFDFYQRVFADPELAPFFSETDAERLRHMQERFFTVALGGPPADELVSLREAHAGRGIEPRHLARFVDHLMEVLAHHGVEERDRYDVCTYIQTYADEVTGAAAIDG